MMNRSREILKRTLRGAILQSPQCISVILVFQRSAAFLIRSRMSCADVAFGGDRELHRCPPIFLQCRTIGLHQRRYLAEPAGVHDQPRVANPCRTLHRHIGLPGDVEWRSTRAHWLHANPGVVDCVEPALVAHPFFGPQPTHQGDALVEPRRPLSEADPEGLELRLPVAQADAEDVVAAGQHVERGGFLGHVHRVERGQNQDIRANRHTLRVRRHVAHDRRDLQHLHWLGQPMMREPEGRKSRVPRRAHLRDHLRDAFC